ncbi:hypothetical protein WN944_001445 [Citrus x changshan-huyou]|uniref:Uncharacterized protein n=1 Tax=Citrus x changshan-huyou TaxID=2935761 RepID=A0AAP0QQR7_9ROSI
MKHAVADSCRWFTFARTIITLVYLDARLPRGIIATLTGLHIHKKKSVAGPVIPENTGDLHIRAWEKLDIDLVKKEKMQSEISLADQIQAAKEKRMESVTREVLQPRSLVIHQV